MKIAIGIKDKETKEINKMFARSPLFAILELADGKVAREEVVENTYAGQVSGAGTAVVEQLAKLGTEAIVCFNLGPKAQDLCKQLEIKVFKTSTLDYAETVNAMVLNNLDEIK